MTDDPRDLEGVQTLDSIAAKALSDSEFLERLLGDPAGVLAEAGLTVPDGVELVVHQNTEERIHLVLPIELETEISALEPEQCSNVRYLTPYMQF